MSAREVDLQSIKVTGLDDAGAATTHPALLSDVLAYETKIRNRNYLQTDRHWFQIAHDFRESVESRFRGISDLTDHLSLPPMGKLHEGVYNSNVATQRNWLLMDQKLVKKTEVCDLLTGEGDLVCVKKATRSKDLSVLFAQGSVVADRLSFETPFRNAVLKAIRSRRQRFLSEKKLRAARIVFAMGIPAQRNLASALSFFSKVNLLRHIERIRRTRLEVAVCAISG
jgi:uncharacterized protein (TIGR04141 family)